MKKHIIISREGGDFSMDLIFAGLVRRFGKENVIDWPPRDKHRRGKPVLVGDHEKDYGAERRALCYVEDCEDMREWTRQEIIQLLMSGEVEYIWLDETYESFVYYSEVADLVPHSSRAVIIAGHDSFRASSMKGLYNRFAPKLAHVFADNWREEWNNLDYVSHTNISCNFDHLWEVEKREEYLQNKIYDICFIGYNSNPVRKIVIDHIKNKWGHLNNYIIFEERPNQFDQFIRHNEMFKVMAQSKICLNLPGAAKSGWALRYYEIPYVGSFMLTCKFKGLEYHLPSEMGTIFDNLEELDFWIRRSLEDEEKRELTAKLDHQICMRYHTIDARMDYIFGVLNG